MASRLSDGARPDVLVVAPVPPGLRDGLQERGLVLLEVDSCEKLIGALDHGPRAVLLWYSDRLRGELIAAQFEDILMSGALLGVILPPGSSADDRARASAVLQSVLGDDFDLLVKEASVRVLQEAEAAEACARHDPGRDQDHALNIDKGTPPVRVDAAEDVLIRRSFADYRTVRLADLTGGFTDTRLLRVEATDDTGKRCSPYVIKIGPHAAVRKERDTTRDFVADWIPFPNHPAIVHDRCVVGARRRTLVSRLVDQADRLDTFITHAFNEDDVALSISLVFEGALRMWRTQSRSDRILIARHYRGEPIRVVPDAAKLELAFQEARRSDSSLGDPTAFLREFDRVGARRADVRVCLAHGDLHVRNIFARRHPGTARRLADVVLIDFERAGVEAHLGHDLATLDVSVALDDLEGQPPSRYDEATLLFPTNPLDIAALPHRGSRDVALKAVREQAIREGLDSAEYAVALAAHLSRYAKFVDTQGVERCAAAYRLAWRVLRGV